MPGSGMPGAGALDCECDAGWGELPMIEADEGLTRM
jgi:hypothetical protein